MAVTTLMRMAISSIQAMKKFSSLFVSVAAAAMALVSCQVEDSVIDNPSEEAVTIRVHASANELKSDDPATKTYIDNTNTILWGTGEYMKLALTAGETTTFANSTDASADAFNGDPEAMFEFSVTPESANEYVYQGLYPASAAATSSNTNAANYKVNLPAIQNATASSYDPAAYIMVAKPETFTSVQTDWVASFRRGTALNKITLKNFASSVEINKVKITAEGKKLAGGRHFNLTTGEGLEVYGTDAAIDVLYATPLTGTTMDVWFTSWDTEIAEGEKLTIIAYTTDNKSYTKEITVPAGKTIKFQEGYLNTLGAKFDGIDPENVTSLDGDYVILAKKDNSTYYALKGVADGSRIASVDYTGNTTSYNGEASLVWTIATSGSGYTIKNGSNFIGWTSGNNADLVAEASYDAAKCLMGIDDNGDGTYKIYVAADATRILARNQSNAYFAFYTGSGYNALVLVPATTLEQVATPTFDTAAGEVTSGTEVAISCATGGATIHYTVDGTDPTSSSASYSSPISITATTTIKAIAVKDGMADSEIATATYSVASAGSVTLTDNDITTGTNTVAGTENGMLAYRLGTSSNNGSVTFEAGYSSITFRLEPYSNTPRTFSVTNGTINGESELAPSAGAPSGTINAGFSRTDTGTEYTIIVTDPSQEVVFSGRRGIVWGFTAVPAGPAVTWNLESIAVTTVPTKTTYTEGESFNPAGMVVTGHFVDADDNTNTKDEEVTGYTITPDGALSTTDDHVTITYQGKSVTQAITVNPAPAGNDGSLEHPYTASEARALAISGDTGSYYISGIVTKIQNQYSASYGTANFWIDENGTDQTVFEGYKIKYFGNVNWVEGNAEITLNDEVIIYGTLTMYNTTPETSSGYLVSLNGKTKGLTLAAPTVTTNDSAKQITVAWTAATGTESAVSYVINCGTQSYNANAAGSHTFTMADYGTYNVSVEATASDAVAATINTSAVLTDPSSATPY